MVRKFVWGVYDAQRSQVLKIALRIADAGYGVYAGFVEIIGSGRQARVKQVMEDCSVQTHRILPRGSIAPIYHHRIHRLQARDRFAQGAGGEQPAISRISLSIDDRDLDVTLQAVVL